MPRVLDRRPGAARLRPPLRHAGRGSAVTTCATPSASMSLEDAVLGAWEGLAAHRSVDCLICGARMAPRYGASGHAPVGGRCAECGASLG